MLFVNGYETVIRNIIENIWDQIKEFGIEPWVVILFLSLLTLFFEFKKVKIYKSLSFMGKFYFYFFVTWSPIGIILFFLWFVNFKI